MKKYLLTEKEIAKLTIMMVLAAGFFGLAGLLSMILMQWITRQNFAEDSVNKHGIGEVVASRLGGAVVFFISVMFISTAVIFGAETHAAGSLGIPLYGWIGTLGCAALGLVEDIRNDLLKPRYRLLSKALIFLIVLGLWPDLVPKEIGIPGIDFLLGYSVIGLIITIIFCVGFLNAANMADGANGLMPGIYFVAFLIFYLEYGGLGFVTLMSSCGLFLIFNVISGRLFLGDAGAYGLGAGVVLAGLFFNAQGIFSASFLAVLLAYPCIEIVVSMARRMITGRSMFLPDNDHLHNRIHVQFKKHFKSQNMANSMTGLSISTMSAGLALAGYLAAWWPITGHGWLIIFCGQCVLYGFVFLLTAQVEERNSDYAVTEQQD
ncbi:undecaprenyl/decaprenyl-phosphate alpha-N-acetylglucosaminyl 1-phosphate transferase [bacterium]|nr:undecaprenyl/decaprenyl-phosphate alpha-N-acetylglucosaminyl 1-phosphate transferase [bacterium]